MKTFEKLLLENKAWAREKISGDPEFFKRLAEIQKPEFLWIGCSDSRVPANEITGTEPGEIFVHRNIANMVVHTDANLLSVLEYAVEHLKVKHVIVCGHYGCGGVQAALKNHDYKPVLNMWLRNIKDVWLQHAEELDKIQHEKEKVDRLVELNVKEQVMHLAETSIIQRAWKHENRPTIHGWVYGLTNGILKPLITLEPDFEVHKIYRFDDL